MVVAVRITNSLLLQWVFPPQDQENLLETPASSSPSSALSWLFSPSASSSSTSFIVDDTLIREFKNAESIGVPFPKDQPMRIYSSIWNADDWATQGGRVKTDWTMAPFIASFRNFSADACIWSSGVNSCNSNSPRRKVWFTQKLNTADTRKLRWVQKYHMVYNYCKDTHRFPEGPAPECRFS